MVEKLRRDTFKSYASIRHSVNQALLAAGSCQKDLIDCEAQELQWSVCSSIRGAEGVLPETFVGAFEVVDKSLNLIMGHAGHEDFAKPLSSTTHPTNC